MNTFTDAQHDALTRIADFDHVFVVTETGDVCELATSWRPSAPEAVDPAPYATELDGWNLPLSGLTGQHGYNGPWLHSSEQIRGGVAEAVLSTPGYWVAIYAQYSCEECGGAGLLWNEDQTEELDCPLIATGECQPGGTTIDGWTMAHHPLTPSIESEV